MKIFKKHLCEECLINPSKWTYEQFIMYESISWAFRLALLALYCIIIFYFIWLTVYIKDDNIVLTISNESK